MRYEETLLNYLRSRKPGNVATVEPVIAEVEYGILIAAIAGSHGAEVIIANLAHFVRIPGITARHWQ